MPRLQWHLYRWQPLVASAYLFVIGLLAVFSVWLDYGLGLVGLAVGSFGLVVGVGMLLIERASAAEGMDEPETQSEVAWGWLRAAIIAVPIVVAV